LRQAEKTMDRIIKSEDEIPEWMVGGPSPWIIAVTVMLATFMEVLDTSIANVALPYIAGNLSATVDEGTWVLTSYLVSNAIVLPLSGWFSSLFGRKRFYLACVILFSLSSLLCGLAPSLELLVLFRVLQGIGGGALMPISQAILVESFSKKKQGIAMAIFGMGVMFAPVIGPSLGGWITDNFSWRWIFLINIPIGAVAFLLTASLIKDPPYLERKSFASGLKIDYIGLSLVAIGLGFLQVVLDNGQKKDWFESTTILWMTVVVAFALIGAVIWELTCREPVVDLRMLGERNFAISNLTMFAVGFVVYGSIVLYPIYLQTLMGYSATQSGMAISPGGVVILLTMPLVGFMLQRIEARWLVATGLLIGGIGLIYIARFNLDIDFRTAVAGFAMRSFGEALLFVPINAAAFYYVPREKTNNGTGLMNLSRNIGGSLGIAVVTTMLARRAQFHQSILAAHMTPANESFRTVVAGAQQLMLAQGADAARASGQAHGLMYGLLQKQSAMMAFADAFWLLGIVYFAMIPLLFLMKKTKPSAGAIGVH
jgi:MFS transporter, DHA2 family, multidrug resistance protein